ncbi:MAG: class I SAM-dependent methyltransferase [Anaerolineae bacterium]|nr:class I SAM-dependent methyltransferase [Anaerolineae bacterium]
MAENPAPRVCDYEGSTYRQDFWQGQGRDYEDRVERIAIRRLLPPAGGRRALEIGAGFGRLTDELGGFREVVLLDYSRTMLAEARARLGDGGGRLKFVAADVYRMPFAPGSFDAATMIRVVHHMADAPAALWSIRGALAPGGAFVLEFANKRNLKAMARHALGRQDWSPYTPEPVEFVELNFDFHPAYMAAELRAAGFTTGARLAVSYFRLGALKRFVPTGALVALDSALQRIAPLYSPSVFTLNQAAGSGPDVVAEPLRFVCPTCGGALRDEGDVLVCAADGARWALRDGVYDFKESI